MCTGTFSQNIHDFANTSNYSCGNRRRFRGTPHFFVSFCMVTKDATSLCLQNQVLGHNSVCQIVNNYLLHYTCDLKDINKE